MGFRPSQCLSRLKFTQQAAYTFQPPAKWMHFAGNQALQVIVLRSTLHPEQLKRIPSLVLSSERHRSRVPSLPIQLLLSSLSFHSSYTVSPLSCRCVYKEFQDPLKAGPGNAFGFRMLVCPSRRTASSV